MSLEIEKRFKNYDYKTIKDIVEEKCNHIGSYIYTFTSYAGIKPGQSIRIRDEGSKITFTIKQKNQNNYDTEWEVVVNDYKMIDAMLTQLNISKKYEMQKYREIYKTKNGKSEIVFDHNPGLPSYIEIESFDEKNLNKTMKMLNLVEEEDFSARDLYYDLYGIPKDRDNSSLLFENAEEVLGPSIKKNKNNFIKILDKQKKY
jgi:predicted adenylyl cyclase CyaB